ncbi:hypothetical protein Airi02_088460 [Actinoallomurus iriomotensis]|uniref:Uncharacterized protein n=1 Tax=Actinoallomurus iriomotensis TaxID=478107 RepID=A0A9W6SDW2_9ACTN|nr:hypothetical protein Airi02_088460 [Actinoallomurus iriomotensis]
MRSIEEPTSPAFCNPSVRGEVPAAEKADGVNANCGRDSPKPPWEPPRRTILERVVQVCTVGGMFAQRAD